MIPDQSSSHQVLPTFTLDRSARPAHPRLEPSSRPSSCSCLLQVIVIKIIILFPSDRPQNHQNDHHCIPSFSRLYNVGADPVTIILLTVFLVLSVLPYQVGFCSFNNFLHHKGKAYYAHYFAV